MNLVHKYNLIGRYFNGLFHHNHRFQRRQWKWSLKLKTANTDNCRRLRNWWDKCWPGIWLVMQRRLTLWIMNCYSWCFRAQCRCGTCLTKVHEWGFCSIVLYEQYPVNCVFRKILIRPQFYCAVLCCFCFIKSGIDRRDVFCDNAFPTS